MMINIFDYYFPYKNVNKRIHLYLPEGAFESEEHYPVMYMYDGHNLFSDEESTYGTSWGLKDFLDSYDKQLIVVGIECSHDGNERLAEYCPYALEEGIFGSGKIEGYGKEYMEWLIHDLKPYIDAHYPTMPLRETTAIGGSSMGGLMAFYSAVAHNQYFSKAACLSPSLAFCQEQLATEWQSADIDPDTRIFFSFSENEVKGFPESLDDVNYYNDELVAIGAESYIHIQPGGGHNEATWQAQNQLYMDILWG